MMTHVLHLDNPQYHAITPPFKSYPVEVFHHQSSTWEDPSGYGINLCHDDLRGDNKDLSLAPHEDCSILSTFTLKNIGLCMNYHPPIVLCIRQLVGTMAPHTWLEGSGYSCSG